MQPSQRVATPIASAISSLVLLVERAVAGRGLRQRGERLHGVGNVLAQFPQVAGNALGDVGIVLFHVSLPYLLDEGCGAGCRSAM